LDEALKNYPSDPQVNFAAIFKTDSTPVERRQRLEAFKQTASDDALGDYLPAANYLKTGQNGLAAEELTAASSKAGFQDYSVAELAQQRSTVQDLARRLDSQPMWPDDWIAYTDRVKNFGEAAAMQWVVAKHRP